MPTGCSQLPYMAAVVSASVYPLIAHVQLSPQHYVFELNSAKEASTHALAALIAVHAAAMIIHLAAA